MECCNLLKFMYFPLSILCFGKRLKIALKQNKTYGLSSYGGVEGIVCNFLEFFNFLEKKKKEFNTSHNIFISN